MATDPTNPSDPSGATARPADTAAGLSARPWYRRPRNLAISVLAVAALVGALLFVVDRAPSPSTGSQSPAVGETIQSYFRESDITATPVLPGEPGTPVLTFPMPPGWSDAGPDTPQGAYGAAFYDSSVDSEFPSSLVFMVSRLSDNADPAMVLDYAPGELQGLPDYRPISHPKRTVLSGFDAVQLSGLYSRDGAERVIAQKTVVIPSQTGLYVLQMNANGPKDEAAAVQAATAVLDEQATIKP